MSSGQGVLGGRTLPAWVGWSVLAASVAAYVGVSLLGHQPFHLGARALRYFDLRVYRGAAMRVAGHASLYPRPIYRGFGFTYPPFAALVMLPLAAAPLAVDAAAVTAGGIALLVWVMRRTLLLLERSGSTRRTDTPERPGTSPAQRWALAALLAGAALWLEPISVTVGYGQINLLITALVIGDLSRPVTARTQGVGIGLAAALKLTPLAFVPYLLMCGRRRAARTAGVVFAASIAAAYLLAPGAATEYWSGGMLFDVSRVGGRIDWANQSLYGAITRAMPHGAPGLPAELLIALLAACGLAIAVRCSRGGDDAAGYCFAALAALLASPVSWTHHWTLAVPALVVLACRAAQRRSRPLWAATAALLVLGYAYAPELAAAAVQRRGPGTLLITNPYVIAALLAITTAGVRAFAHAAATRRAAHGHGPGARPLSIQSSSEPRTT